MEPKVLFTLHPIDGCDSAFRNSDSQILLLHHRKRRRNQCLRHAVLVIRSFYHIFILDLLSLRLECVLPCYSRVIPPNWVFLLPLTVQRRHRPEEDQRNQCFDCAFAIHCGIWLTDLHLESHLLKPSSQTSFTLHFTLQSIQSVPNEESYHSHYSNDMYSLTLGCF